MVTASARYPDPPHVRFGRARARARISCVICTTPRTGSWLLSEALLASGLAGRPEEYLRHDWYLHYVSTRRLDYHHQLHFWPGTEHRKKRWQNGLLGDDANCYSAFLQAVLNAGTSGAIFGIKIHRGQLDEAVKLARLTQPGITDVELILSWLPQPRFVFLHRLDTIRRAVSHLRAIRSGVWWQYENISIPEAPINTEAVDVETIDRLMLQNRAQNHKWRRFFRSASVRPLVITYENLIQDINGAVRAVLSHLGVESELAQPLPPPRLRRQSDDWTEYAVQTYLAWKRHDRQLH